MQELKKRIEENENQVITTHKSPDGDAIGSSVAWYRFLKKKNRNVVLILPDQPPAFLLPFLRNVDYLVYEDNPDYATQISCEANVLFCLDYNAKGRVGTEMESLFDKTTAFKIMIDHHTNPDAFCDLMISRPTVCSTAQMIYQCIQEMGELDKIDVTIAEGIYLGIMTDTGSFRFPSVDKHTHQILAHLLEIGLEHHHIHEAIYDVNSMDRLQLRGYAIAEKLEILEGLPIGIISLTLDELNRFNYQKGDTEGLVNVILSIEGMQVGAFFTERKEGVKISFRSKGNYYVNEFSARNFGGGGHKYAAGGESSDSLDVTIERFKSLVWELIP